MVYLMGDTHGDFRRIANFCKRFETSVDDVMIILGDAGINFSGGLKDQAKKDYIAAIHKTSLLPYNKAIRYKEEKIIG